MITCAKIYMPAIADKVMLVGADVDIYKSSYFKLFNSITENEWK